MTSALKMLPEAVASGSIFKTSFFLFFYLCKDGFHLISRYAGRNVTAVVGSSLNFPFDFGFLISLNSQ